MCDDPITDAYKDGLEGIMSKALKAKHNIDHYDIYVYKGWTLREWQQPKYENEYDQKKRKWINTQVGTTTKVVWGIHQQCGLRGIIMSSCGKVYCNYCGEAMPSDVFINMSDALSFMQESLEK